MTFKSSLLLEKHKKRFCIGGECEKTKEKETPLSMLDRVRELHRLRQEKRLQHPQRLDGEQPEQMNQRGEDRQRSEPRTPGDGSPPGFVQSATHKEHPRTTTRTIPDPTGRAVWLQRNRSLVNNHERELASLLKTNKELEWQKRDMDLRLQELSAQSRSVFKVERTLTELRDQEHRNTHLLETLLDMLQHANTDTSAVRFSYLQNGGSDPVILAPLQELLHESLHMERNQKRGPQSQIQLRTQHHDPSKRRRDLTFVEMENQRLEEEILRLQLQKRGRGGRGAAVTTDTHCRHVDQQQYRAMKTDMELLKQELEISRLRRQISTNRTQKSPALLPPLGEVRSETAARERVAMENVDALRPAPYDPVAGLVVFYDFLLGLSPSLRLCRLLVGLSMRDEDLGGPTALPPACCQPASHSSPPTHASLRGHLAVLATRQDVPRLHPASAVSLVLQLQAAGGYDAYGQEVRRLVLHGWTKLDLFDRHNRAVSGRWKLPVRVPPVRPSMTSGEINTVPQLDSAELYLRIVNSRDADSQSSAPISVSNMALYRYPPSSSERSRNSPYTHPSNQVPYHQTRRTSQPPLLYPLQSTGHFLHAYPTDRPTSQGPNHTPSYRPSRAFGQPRLSLLSELPGSPDRSDECLVDEGPLEQYHG
ncbi:coiled-coil domain-containing protein 17 [Aplochiton taeniatus]